MSVRARAWCVTSFDLTLVERLPVLVESRKLRYAACQVEKCPTTGREHLQAYIEFPAPRTLKSGKDVIGDVSAHFEVRRGSAEEARNYVRKEETRVRGPWEWGEFIGGQGQFFLSLSFHL